jgi:hypothetical protein
MIIIQSYTKIDSVIFFFDEKGIEEMISYLNDIKNNNTSFHLTSDNELDEIPFDEEIFIVPHSKIVNVDKLER